MRDPDTMAYTYRRLTDDQKRDHLERQLLQAEHDHFVHTTNAELARAAGNDDADAHQALADTAEAVATVTADLLAAYADIDD